MEGEQNDNPPRSFGVATHIGFSEFYHVASSLPAEVSLLVASSVGVPLGITWESLEKMMLNEVVQFFLKDYLEWRMDDSAGKWLWEVTTVEHISEVCHQNSTLLIAYHLTLHSCVPVKSHHVRQALVHLHRKVPCLRACYGKRNGTLWLREVANEDIDFKVLPESDMDGVMNCLRIYRYNSFTGPLWCARLVLIGHTTDSTHTSPKAIPPDTHYLSSSATSDDLFQYTSHLFLGFHHGIVDGVTVMKICGYTVSLLDDVIAGEIVDDKEQLGVHKSGEETARLIQVRRERMAADPELVMQWKQEMQMSGDWKTLLKQIHEPEDGEEMSLHTERELNGEMTEQFFKRCRNEGVTIHSAFTAVAHLALKDLLFENGIDQETYTINCSHLVNVRRYWQGDVSRAFGCHLLPNLSISMNVPKTLNKETFWDVARLIHGELQSKLKSGFVLDQEAFDGLCGKKLNFDLFLNMPLPADFYTSNLGDVTGLVAVGKERHVRVHTLLRSVSIHKRDSTCSHLFHTFRGRLIHVLDYNTRFVSTRIAKAYTDKIFEHLLEIV